MSSTASGADARGHIRGESIAVKRGSTTTPQKSQPLRSSFTDRRGSNSDAFETLARSAGISKPLKLAAAIVLVWLIVHFGTPALHERSVAQHARHRKARLAGRGESFVLPKRFRENHNGGEELPECKRVLLFVFSESAGFSSEIFLYLRAAVVANKLGYTLLAEDQVWNYGGLRDYFLPKQIHCSPPRDWFLPAAPSTVPLGSKRWTSSDRVYVSRELAGQLDAWIREEMLDPSAVAELKQRDLGHILPEGEALPGALEEVFNDFAAAARDLFARPNDQLATMIRKQRMELGLGQGGLRHRKNSPTWGGNRRAGTNDRAPPPEADEEEFEEAGGAERSDRGPLIGTHWRLGGKSAQWRKDLDLLGATKQVYGNQSAIVEGASDAVRRLSRASISQPSFTRGNPTIFPSHSTPTLIIMSAESAAFTSLQADPSVLAAFHLKRTSPPPIEDLRQWQDVLKLDGGKEVEPAALTAFSQEKFNALPLSLRVHLTRYFLRDLISLSLYSDAFIVSGASHLGRLACLIAGEGAVVGPRDITGRGLGGRIRSIDVPWYPTSSASALF